MRTTLLLAALALLPVVTFAQEPCEEDPRYLLVTVVRGTLYYPDGEGLEPLDPRELDTGPYLLDMCDGYVSMSNHLEGADVLVQHDSGIRDTITSLIVRETLDELCRVRQSCAVVGDNAK